MQVVWRHAELPLIDLDATPDARFDTLALDRPPLLRLLHRRTPDGVQARLQFHHLIAQARLGVSEAEHEAFFRGQLGDIDEPTLPFGLRDIQADAGQIGRASCRERV